MDDLEKVLDKIEEGLSNLKQKTIYNTLRNINSVDFLVSGVQYYKKSHNPDYLKGLIDEFYKTSIATPEGTATYDESIWNTNIEVQGKFTTLDEVFEELESCYKVVYS